MQAPDQAPDHRIAARVRARLRAALPPGASLLLGLSGGVDSVVLLHVLRELAPQLRFSLRALYVNHGISAHAGEWQAFCQALCARLGVPFEAVAVDIHPYRALGLEGAARQARHEALAAHAAGGSGFTAGGADFIVLAQHRDDQAETLLLQLARGAGVRGLAGMPADRGVEGSRARLLRPLIDVPRADIEAYARREGHAWVEDESNADTALKRNFLRAEILPRLAEAFPGAPAAMARSAALAGDASLLLDQMADEDLQRLSAAEGAPAPGALPVSGLRALGGARARNALRRWMEQSGVPWPGFARLGELLRQLTDARGDAQLAVDVKGWSLRRYRGWLRLQPPHAPLPAAFLESWNGEPAMPLVELGGVLRFRPEEGRGLSVDKLRAAPVTLRLREGGEALRTDPGRPLRTLKNLFQEAGLPPWERERLPLVYCGDTLVAVPGIGEACDWKAQGGERGLLVNWERLGDDGRDA